MIQPGRAVSRERILSNVWGAAEDPLTNVVDVYVCKLRLKLNDPDGTLIATLRGHGYRLDPQGHDPGDVAGGASQQPAGPT
jgi:DNA-binding response OmpR family regulator